MVINGQTYTASFSGSNATFNIGVLNISDNITAVVSVTDSRGITTNKDLPITILNWELPTAIITLQRQNNFYSETDINVNAEYSSLDNKNTISIKVRYKKVSDATYSNWTTLQDDVKQQFTLDNNYEWNVQVVLEDRIGTTTYNLVLNRGIPIAVFDRLKRSLGINCFPKDTESLEVNDLNILNKILGTELYNNTTGSNSAITLSESAANFTYLEIFYRNNDNYYNSTKIYQPNGKIAYLDADYPYTSDEGYSYAKKTSVQISGTSIRPINYVELTVMPSGANILNKNNIYITRVVGY